MENLIFSTLKENGHLVSQQRKIIISEICKAGEIEDVERFWIELRSRHAISWATVYSNLRLLTRMGFICRSHYGGGVSLLTEKPSNLNDANVNRYK